MAGSTRHSTCITMSITASKFHLRTDNIDSQDVHQGDPSHVIFNMVAQLATFSLSINVK